MVDPTYRRYFGEMRSDFYSNLSEEEIRFYEMWNSATDESTLNVLITELLTAQAQRYASLPAVEYGERQLTYGELERRTNQIARLLKERCGVREEERIGIFLKPSINVPLALLAVLKSSAAFVPLDPCYPPERLAYMARDADLSVILTSSDLVTDVPFSDCTILQIDALERDIDEYSTDPVEAGLHPSSLAYMIYTSGSTGRPKGVMIEHRGLPNMALAEARSYRIGVGYRVLQYASINFDASICDFLMSWMSGAVVCLIDNEDRAAGRALNELLRKKRINAVVLTPTVLAATPSTDLPELKTIGSAGESCSSEIVERWGSGRHFVNSFGPTENTVVATAAEKEDCYPSITIGKPIANVRLYTIDEDDRQVGVGQVGEIAIAGIQVARGYHNHPEMTAERFIRDPLGEDASSRLFKSGDLGRITAGATLEYVGRKDDQLKLRGLRIEPGEIESTINKFSGVMQSSVVLIRTSNGDQRLVAYVCGEATAGELREHLASMLPAYMIPNHFVFVESIPVTPNGKVDKKLLETYAAEETAVTTGPLPQTTIEMELAEHWRALLEISVFSTSDNFFELGGYSLLAVQFVERVRESLGVELDLKLLTLGTFKEVARHCEELIEERNRSWSFRLRRRFRLV